MRIVIAGGHGQIALRLERLLAARGDEVAGIVRRAEQADDLRAAGAEPVVLDLESASVEEVAERLRGANAAVFAAGAGPGSGAARKDTVDKAAAVLFADAAVRAGVRRFLVVSSMGADPRHQGDEIFDVYLRAKGEADAYVSSLDALDWTILRPGDGRRGHGSGASGGAHRPRPRSARRRRGRPGGTGRHPGHQRPDPGADQRFGAGVGRGEVGGRELRPAGRPGLRTLTKAGRA
ncbi:nucleoside-diphosphate-sugar epimerase [Streptomyces collinus]